MKKFEKEFKQFTQMFGRNGSFLSTVQVRLGEWWGLEVLTQRLIATTAPVPEALNFLLASAYVYSGTYT